MRVFLLAVAAVAAIAAPQRFDGHRVLTLKVDTISKRDSLKQFGWDVWSPDGFLVVGTNDVRVPPGGLEKLKSLNISFTEFLSDVQSAVDATMKSGNRTGTADPWFDNYHPYPELINWYNEAASKYQQFVHWQVIGQSIENRVIGLFTIDAKGGSGQKKTAWIQAGIHAREWISPATTNFIVNELLEQYGNNDTITNLLDKVTLHVVPVVNPDGYVFTWNNDRMWRKNRRNSGNGAYGVDINRNYGSHWGCCGGSSGDPRSETYRGTAPFSEPESDALSRMFLALRPQGGLDMHSYSQLILRAWGWTRVDCPDEDALRQNGDRMAAAIAQPFGTQFVNQKKIDLYVTDGTASDWMYDPDEGAGAKYSYSIELRDTGRYGFLLPPDQIVPSGEEMLQGVLAWLTSISNE